MQASAGLCAQAGAEHCLKDPGVQHTFLAGAGERAAVQLGPMHRAACLARTEAKEKPTGKQFHANLSSLLKMFVLQDPN